MKKVIFLVLSMCIASHVSAIGNLANAKVVKIRVDVSGKAMIFFDRIIEGTPPACVHDAYKSALGVDASTEGGKAVLSMALTAKTSGSFVTVYGLGVCGVYGGNAVETWNHGFLL